jgi:hypothetical protein
MRMTLRDFIEQMKAGWGFWRPHRVSQIGLALEALAQRLELDLDTPVEVEFKRGSYGWGPSFHYTYRWYVKGVSLPREREGRLPPGVPEVMFGYRLEELPFLQVDEEGFTVGYDW